MIDLEEIKQVVGILQADAGSISDEKRAHARARLTDSAVAWVLGLYNAFALAQASLAFERVTVAELKLELYRTREERDAAATRLEAMVPSHEEFDAIDNVAREAWLEDREVVRAWLKRVAALCSKEEDVGWTNKNNPSSSSID